MKNTTKLLSGLFAVAIVTITVASTSAFAYQGDPSVQGPNYSPETHEAIQNALNANDYATWQNLMEGKGRIAEKINSDNFSKFAEANKLAQAGDIEGSQAIRAELGLGLRDGNGQGRGNGSQMKGSGQGNGPGLKNGNGRRVNSI